MIDERDKKWVEEYLGASYNEILKVAKKNLKDAGYDIDDHWIKSIFDDVCAVAMCYDNKFPKDFQSTFDLYYFLTTD